MKNQIMQVLAIQKKTFPTPEQNMDEVRRMLDGYSGDRPDFMLLPEIFTCPYDNSCFPVFAQKDGGEVFCFLQELARKNQCYLIGGSVPEADESGRLYNTSYVFDRAGCLIGKHRKAHLFDIDVPGGQYFKESDVLSPGKEMTVFDTEYGRMGVCICFDIRFPDLFLQMRRAGVRMVFVPAAFNMTTASYIAYGHSIVTDPWGRILKELDEKEGILDIELDLAETDRIRTQIPLGQ